MINPLPTHIKELVNKVINYANTTSLPGDKSYWNEFTPEELDILQSMYYVGRDVFNNKENHRENDSIESIMHSYVRKNRDNDELYNWNITTVKSDSIITFLSNGLKYFM